VQIKLNLFVMFFRDKAVVRVISNANLSTWVSQEVRNLFRRVRVAGLCVDVLVAEQAVAAGVDFMKPFQPYITDKTKFGKI
jgi:hypothetical protein